MNVKVGELIDRGVIEAVTGFPSGAHNQNGEGIAHLRPFNVTTSGIGVTEQLKYVPASLERAQHMVLPGDVLFNNTNSEELVGKTALWTRSGSYTLSNHMTRLRVLRPDELSNAFLAFALHAQWRSGMARQLCRRHVAQASIIGERFREMPIAQLSKPEQDAVSGTLNSVQSATLMAACLTNRVRELKQAAMRHLFAREWPMHHIGDVMTLTAGGTPSRVEPSYWAGGTIPWVKTGEVDYREITRTEEHITAAGLANSAAKVLPAGTVLVAMYGQGVTRGKVGVLGIPAATNQACLGLQPKSEAILPRFVYHYLTYSYDELRGRAHGGQQQNLNRELVATFEIPCPPVQEQQEIVDVLDAIDRKIDLHERKRATLQELFDTLLHDLMTGRLRVGALAPDAPAAA